MREAVYIVSRTWNSSFRVLASDFLFHRLNQFPVCLEHWHISMVGDVSSSPGAGNNSNPGGLCHWSWKRTNDCDQWHLSHLLPCPPMWLIPALFCLPVCFSDAYLFLMTWTDAGKHIRLGRCTQCSLSLSLCGPFLVVSGETACCWTRPCWLGWVTSGWWRLSRWRHSVESRTSTAASPCPPEVPPCPTLEN